MNNCTSSINIFIGVILITCAVCNQLTNYYFPRPRVEVLVWQPKGEEFSFAKLSPKRDKLFYRLSDRIDFVLDLVTGQTDQLQNKCNVWLDNETLVCGNKDAFYLLDVRDFSRTSIEPVNGEEQSYTKFIKDNDQIYRYRYQISPTRSESFILIKSTDDRWSYLFNIKDRSQFDEDVSMISIPYIQDSPHISPNGKYDVQTGGRNAPECLTFYLGIYDNSSENQRLVSGNCVHSEYDIVGWMYDSSGVIYVTERGYVDFHPYHIYKLNVSLKEGLIRLARNSLMGLIGLMLIFGILYLLRHIKTVSPKRGWL